jgi:hypothetical protein
LPTIKKGNRDKKKIISPKLHLQAKLKWQLKVETQKNKNL